MAKIAGSRRRRKSKGPPDPYELGSAASATAILGLVACSLQALQVGGIVAVRLQGALGA